MPFPAIDPVFLRLGPLQFRWYGLMYLLAFLAGYFILQGEVRRHRLSWSRDEVADLIFTLALGVVLGGRLGYVVFYNPGYYLAAPWRVLAVWEGGMSFHGGLLGVMVAGWWSARRRRVDFLLLADLVMPAVPVGLFLGRLGNFINGELYGRATALPWGMVFPGGGPLPRHPSQLYEAALEGVLLFLLLWWLRRRPVPAGTLTGVFLAGYGLCRFLVEFCREPDEQLGFLVGWLTMGQLLSLPLVLAGVGLCGYLFSHRQKPVR